MEPETTVRWWHAYFLVGVGCDKVMVRPWVWTLWASCKRASIVCIVWAEVVFPQGSGGFVVVCLARRHVMCEEPPRRYKMKTTPKQIITQQRTRKTRRTLAVKAQGLVLLGSGHGKPLPGARYLPIRSFSARYLPVIYLRLHALATARSPGRARGSRAARSTDTKSGTAWAAFLAFARRKIKRVSA